MSNVVCVARARLAMQDDNGDVREGFTRRNLSNENVRRRLFVDEDDDETQESRRGRDENRTNVFFEEARKNLKQVQFNVLIIKKKNKIK